MEITYLGHSCFQLKGKRGTVVTDPYQEYVGFKLPHLSADVVTISHDHPDHNQAAKIEGTARRAKPFLVTQPGEYEVGGISVFGIQTYHDDTKGVERGLNTIYNILLDDLRVCHLGDLGHSLTNELLEDIGAVDILLCPVGGHFTIGAEKAVEIINQLEPSYIIPMHFKTDQHDEKVFGDMSPVEAFFKEYGMKAEPTAKLKVEKATLPEETELVLLTP